MKRFSKTIAAAAVAVACLVASSCSSAPAVKGVSLALPASEFISELQKKGFSLDSPGLYGAYVLSGPFAGLPFCKISVTALDDGKIQDVYVSTGELYSWSNIYNEFYELYGALAAKYGEPEYKEMKFKTVFPVPEGQQMDEIRKGHCSYNAKWFKGGYVIFLKIDDDCEVKILYTRRAESNSNSSDYGSASKDV